MVSRVTVAKQAEAAGRYGALDGLRGLAALAIVFHHSVHVGDFPHGPLLDSLALSAIHGVSFFFTISGFIITHLLLREESRNGEIQLKDFFWRRALRILPAAWFYLAVIGLLTLAGLVAVPGIDLLSSLLFVRNFYIGSDLTAHFWSLAVEEHFYMLWPLLLVLLPKTPLRLWVLLGMLAATPFWVHAVIQSNPHDLVSTRTDLRLEPILTGCIAAFAKHYYAQSRLYGLLLRRSAMLWVWSALLLTLVVVQSSFKFNALLYSAVNALVVLAAVDGHGPRSLLASRPLLFAGTLSYSLYLWQQLFNFAVLNEHLYTSLPAIFVAAWLSYRYIEQPFLRLRHRVQG